MFVYTILRLEAVPPHLVYIIKFFVAHQIVYPRSIPVHIRDISLAESKKLTQTFGKQAWIVYLPE